MILSDTFLANLFVMKSSPGALPGGNLLISDWILPGIIGLRGSYIGTFVQ